MTGLTGAFLFATTTARSSNALLGWNVGYSFFSNVRIHPPSSDILGKLTVAYRSCMVFCTPFLLRFSPQKTVEQVTASRLLPRGCSVLLYVSSPSPQLSHSLMIIQGSDHRAVCRSQYPRASLRLWCAHLWRRSACALAAI